MMSRILTLRGQQPWYSAILLYLANAILVVDLFRLKGIQFQTTNIRYFTGSFLALTTFVFAVIGILTWSAFTGRWQDWLGRTARPERAILLAAAVLFSAVVIGISQRHSQVTHRFNQDATDVFATWLMVINLWWFLLLMFTPRTTPSPSLRKAFVLVGRIALVAVVVPLLTLEIGVRVWFTYFGQPQERIVYTNSLEDIQRLTWRFTGIPYLNYGLTPDYSDHNSLGYRGPEFSLEKPAGTFRIVAMGGSTTYGATLENWRDAYPAQLERILHDEYGYAQVEVINAGVGGYSTWDLLADLTYRILDLDPDLVIIYTATNDVSFRLVDPAYYSGLNWVRGIWKTEYDQWLSPSVLYRYVAINLGWIANPSALDSQFYHPVPATICEYVTVDLDVVCRNFGMTTDEVLAANPPVYFERNLRNMAAIAQANDVQVLLSTWAYFPEDMGPGTANYMAEEWRQQATDEHNAIIRRVAEAMDVAFYDLMGNMPHNRDFWTDGRHCTPLGTHEQASQYAAFMVAEGLLPPLPDDS